MKDYFKIMKEFINYQKADPNFDSKIDSLPTVNGLHKSVIRGDNKLFKGHKFDLIYSNVSGDTTNDKGHITLYQSYFRGSVTSSYNVKDEKTYNSWITNGSTPKWLDKKLNQAGECLTGITSPVLGVPHMQFTLESKEVGKYGRVLGTLLIKDININKTLVQEGFAVEYWGGKKKK